MEVLGILNLFFHRGNKIYLNLIVYYGYQPLMNHYIVTYNYLFYIVVLKIQFLYHYALSPQRYRVVCEIVIINWVRGLSAHPGRSL